MVEENNEKEIVKSKGINIKWVAIGLVIFLVTVAGSFFVIRTALAPLLSGGEDKAEESQTVGTLVELGEFTVNILDVNMARYLKTEIVLEVSDEKLKEEIETTMLPVVRDEIISILSTKTVADLDSHNREDLKKEIIRKLKKQLGNGVTNVYFSSFIMQ